MNNGHKPIRYIDNIVPTTQEANVSQENANQVSAVKTANAKINKSSRNEVELVLQISFSTFCFVRLLRISFSIFIKIILFHSSLFIDNATISAFNSLPRTYSVSSTTHLKLL